MTEDIPEYGASNRQRRVLEAVTDLPQPWPTTRARGVLDQASRHLHALRSRLNWLVKTEVERGDDQRGAEFNRAERNALIWAINQLGPSALGDTPAPATGKGHDPAYVLDTFARIEECQSNGFTQAKLDQPGVLLHQSDEARPPMETSLTIWFYFLALSSRR